MKFIKLISLILAILLVIALGYVFLPRHSCCEGRQIDSDHEKLLQSADAGNSESLRQLFNIAKIQNNKTMMELWAYKGVVIDDEVLIYEYVKLFKS